MSTRIFASTATCAFALLAAQPFYAQSLPKGTFTLSDEGFLATQPYAAEARLTLDGAGNVTGTEVLKTFAQALTLAAKGTYTMSSPTAGTMSLALTGTSGDDTIELSANYRFLTTASGDLVALRTDAGVYAISTLAPAKPVSALKGAFAFTELGTLNSAQPYATIGELSFDGNGAVTGSATTEAGGAARTVALTGTYAVGADGIGTLTLTASTTDDDGNTVTQALSYQVVVAGGGAIKAVRVDVGVVAVAEINQH